MAAEANEVFAASDMVEEPRVMDGYILRKEIFSSASLSTRVTITYLDSGAVASMIAEDA